MNKPLALGSAIALLAATAQAQDTPSPEKMWQLIQQQQAEITRLKAKVEASESKLQETDVKITATAEAVEAIGSSGGASANLGRWVERTTIGGYGEHHFNHFSDGDDQVDAHRFVLYFGHQFADNLKFFSELELEHGFIEDESECEFDVPAGGFAGGETVECEGGSSPGEVELEQAYVQWDYAENQSLVAGQYLVPVGILNETHEPDTFYGTERNKIESNIIPTTWWETGVMLKGDIAPGLSYNAAVHSGLKIDIDDGHFKVRDGRQKSAKATAEDLAYTLRLKYNGVPGLELAATFQQQADVTQGLALDDADARLYEAHAIYSSGPFGVRALWARWDIDGDFFESLGADQQEGWFIEPAYRVLDNLGLFVRYSEYNNLAGIGTTEDSETWDYGLNYWLNEHVVIKADYSDNEVTGGNDNDSFNLGIGWSF